MTMICKTCGGDDDDDEGFALVMISVEGGSDDAYRNNAFPERACDHCGQPYRGPAVYCRHECALADA
jgi:hypothetical protein